MVRTHFHESLDRLQADVVHMGELTLSEAEQVVGLGLEGRGDLSSAIESEVRSVRALRMDVEGRCITLFATQSPMAGDLRRLSSIFKIAADFESMAESLLQVARVVAGRKPRPSSLEPLSAFASRLLETLSHTVRFCEAGEPTDARRVRELAQQGDAVEKIEAALVASIQGAEDASERMPLLRLIPEVERVMDQCRKIVERVEYALPSRAASVG
jgi:phosphate transport system protein